MAKEQKRGNKEIKKPKKVKLPAAEPVGLTRGTGSSNATPPKPKKS